MTGPTTTEAIDPGVVDAGIVFHDHLNPRLFETGDHLRLDVRAHLLRAASAFYDFLDVTGLRVISVLFTGSNASYNYTRFSDCDVHIVVDYDRSPAGSLAENLFSTKKALWGSLRDVRCKGYPVELYVEDSREPVTALGVYDLLKGDWMKKPRHVVPTWDDAAVYAKADHLADQIDTLIASSAPAQELNMLLARIYRMRQAGLEEGGEFSTENLAFKALRNLGLIDQLRSARIKAEDTAISL